MKQNLLPGIVTQNSDGEDGPLINVAHFITWNDGIKLWWKEPHEKGHSHLRSVLIHDVQVHCLASASSCFIHRHLGKTLHSHCSQEALWSATKDTLLPVWAWFLILFIWGARRGCLFYAVYLFCFWDRGFLYSPDWLGTLGTLPASDSGCFPLWASIPFIPLAIRHCCPLVPASPSTLITAANADLALTVSLQR